MSDTVIRVENLSKKYVLSHQQDGQKYKALRDVIADGARAVGQKLLKPSKASVNPNREEFWALKDVSFEIKQGDRVGIIGRNGAGKSTLLKVLSRIVEPTNGKISINGRVASLLEVGTGFHPELTGRENVYLNGAILGMGREEIKRKFDEIVAFAEVEKFLDTPVKRYSSGMYVRLAFSVAAHLEQEILIVDEVLAVGDAQFQEKCLGKMEDVSKNGRTVIFVSHNLGAIKALCGRGIFLKQGNLVSADSIDEVIKHYNRGISPLISSEYLSNKISQKPHFLRINIAQSGNQRHSVFDIDQSICIEFEVENYDKKGLAIGIHIKNDRGICVHHSSDEFSIKGHDESISHRKCIIPPHALAAGKYYVDVFLGQRNVELFDAVSDVLAFEVEFVGAMMDKTTTSDWKGICGPGLLSWY